MDNLYGSRVNEKKEYESRGNLGFALRKATLNKEASLESLEIFKQIWTTSCKRWLRGNGLIKGGTGLGDL